MWRGEMILAGLRAPDDPAARTDSWAAATPSGPVPQPPPSRAVPFRVETPGAAGRNSPGDPSPTARARRKAAQGAGTPTRAGEAHRQARKRKKLKAMRKSAIDVALRRPDEETPLAAAA